MKYASKVLVYLAYKYQGDWAKIYDAICLKKEYSDDIDTILSSIKYKIVTLLDDEYPESLKHIYHPPFVLFYYGDISLLQDKDKNLAVVGSRDYSQYGKAAIESVMPELVKHYNIVSGLAYGIDTISHESAIKNGGKTIAVLGSGIDYCYPKENFETYEKIKKDHLVISEYPGNMAPEQSHFPIRNRIVAGLSKGLLVVEAGTTSGTMITAQIASENGNDIMCFPSENLNNSGANVLIKQGATLVENADDIIYQLDGKIV